MEILELQPAWVWMQHLELIVDIRKRMCIWAVLSSLKSLFSLQNTPN